MCFTVNVKFAFVCAVDKVVGTKVVHFQINPNEETVISSNKGHFRFRDNKVAPAGKRVC